MTHAASPRERARPINARNPEDRILARLHDELRDPALDRFFPRQARLRLHDDRLDVTVPTGYLAEVISQKFGATLQRAAEAESGVRDRAGRVRLSFRVDRSAFVDSSAADAANDGVRPARAPAAPRATPRRLRLDDFVVGASNEIAFAAATRAADLDSPMSGPLFIHGPCGLGKTHLLQGIEDVCRRKHPSAKVVYTTAEAFTNEFVAACRANRVDGFRRAYRAAAVLCIDDVHFLSSKDATQGELLHTFDALGQFGGRLVLASDEHPRRVRSFSAALVSRFMSGAVVELRAPDADLRARLVETLARRRGLVLGEGAVAAISSANGSGSVRDLEGSLARVEAAYRLAGGMGAIGALLARRALEPSTAAAPRPVRPEQIISRVCETLRVADAELRGTGRHPRVVLARGLIVHLCRALTTLSFPEIARAMGRPNHSSVVTSGKRLAALLEQPESPLPELAGLEPIAGLSLPGLRDHLRRDLTSGGAAGPSREAR